MSSKEKLITEIGLLDDVLRTEGMDPLKRVNAISSYMDSISMLYMAYCSEMNPGLSHAALYAAKSATEMYKVALAVELTSDKSFHDQQYQFFAAANALSVFALALGNTCGPVDLWEELYAKFEEATSAADKCFLQLDEKEKSPKANAEVDEVSTELSKDKAAAEELAAKLRQSGIDVKVFSVDKNKEVVELDLNGESVDVGDELKKAGKEVVEKIVEALKTAMIDKEDGDIPPDQKN